MALIEDRKLRQSLDRRLASMANEQTTWRPHWAEVSRFCQPRLGRYLGSDGKTVATGVNTSEKNRGDRKNDKLLDARGIGASDILANGMYSGMSSPSQEWFDLEVDDPDLNRFHSVKLWLGEVKATISNLLASTNFYTSVKSGYLENGVFGTEAAVMLEHWQHKAVTYPMTAGEYWISLDDGLVPDTLYRRCDMTVIQMAQRFSEGGNIGDLPRGVRRDYDNSNYQRNVPVFHAIEPNLEREGDKIDRTNKPYRSIYWTSEADENDKDLLSFGGFDERPFWAARWDLTGMDTYGRSPAMNALADLKGLQLQNLRKQQAADYSVRPSLKGPPQLLSTFANLTPGGLTALAMVDDATFAPIWEVRPEVLGHLRDDVIESRDIVDHHFYVPLFMAISRMQGVQPRTVEEIAKRNEEQLSQLGPVTERVQTEKLAVVIDRAFDICARQGRLPPPPPELAPGTPIKITFVSIMAKAQRLLGVGAIERYLSFTGNLAAVWPEVLDKVDPDAAMDEYAHRVGVPAKINRSPEALDEHRQAQAQQAQAAQAAAAAPAAAQGAKAAELLSKTDMGDGTSMLQRLSGINAA